MAEWFVYKGEENVFFFFFSQEGITAFLTTPMSSRNSPTFSSFFHIYCLWSFSTLAIAFPEPMLSTAQAKVATHASGSRGVTSGRADPGPRRLELAQEQSRRGFEDTRLRRRARQQRWDELSR